MINKMAEKEVEEEKKDVEEVEEPIDEEETDEF